MTWNREGMHWVCVCVCVHFCIYVCVCVCTWRRRDSLGTAHQSRATVSLGRVHSSGSPPFPCPGPALLAVQSGGWGSGPTFPTLSGLWLTPLQGGESSLSLLVFSISVYTKAHTYIHKWVHAAFHNTVQTFLAIKSALTKPKVTILYWRIPIIAVFPWLRRWSCLYRSQEEWTFFLPLG